MGFKSAANTVCTRPRKGTGAGGWESARFQIAFWLEAGSGKAALSRPAHPRYPLKGTVSHTAGQMNIKWVYKGL
jgi:hypothetical protein